MLNTMRRNLKSLSWVLWITVASFVIAIFAVWGGGGDTGSTTANWMARVNGSPVSVVQFQNAFRNLDSFYRQIYQGNYDARSLGIARQSRATTFSITTTHRARSPLRWLTLRKSPTATSCFRGEPLRKR